jgi:hypothetical protein
MLLEMVDSLEKQLAEERAKAESREAQRDQALTWHRRATEWAYEEMARAEKAERELAAEHERRENADQERTRRVVEMVGWKRRAEAAEARVKELEQRLMFADDTREAHVTELQALVDAATGFRFGDADAGVGEAHVTQESRPSQGWSVAEMVLSGNMARLVNRGRCLPLIEAIALARDLAAKEQAK